MSEIAISVQSLSKQYYIGHVNQSYNRLGEQVADVFLAPIRRLGKLLRGQSTGAAELDELMWALNDITFEVKRGEVIGIIGRNGAGKSTLLKILSRITEPTTGYADIYGRISSLLEVGTGFHPELTGRENIYFNGAILGMRKTEIDRNFEAIVEFSEIERFIDTPVKHYSSGMYVRLAFAVAAHLEPEILVVDEVLAVGDVAFQKKCLGKMNEVSQTGRTILFVSHNMTAVQNLCTRGIVLVQGKMVYDGGVAKAIRHYLAALEEGSVEAFTNNPERSGNGQVQLTSARVLNELDEPVQYLIAGRSMRLEFSYQNHRDGGLVYMAVTIYNHFGIAATSFDMRLTDYYVSTLGSEGKFVCHIPNLPLPVGQYRVAAAVYANEQAADHIPNILIFNVESSVFFTGSQNPSVNYCTVMTQHDWQHYPTA